MAQPVSPTASFGRYIVDFACPGAHLAIEIDGGQHAMMREADDARSTEIAAHGYRIIIRFWNKDVMENLEGALHTISEELKRAFCAPSDRRDR